MNSTSGSGGNGSLSNNTDAPQHFERTSYFYPVYDSCLIVLAVFIIAINILVPVLFIRNRALRSKTNMLLVSLAVADMVMGLVGIPMFISCNSLYMFTEYAGVCFTAAVVYRFIAVSTIFHIFAITIERYISVSYPFKYVTWVKMSRLRVVIASIWIVSLLMAHIQLSWQNMSQDYYLKDDQVDPVLYRAGLIYNIIGVLVCFMIPLAVMFFIYWRMFMIIRKQIKRIKEQNISGYEANCKPLSSERRAITIFALMLGLFTTCWLTWYISLLANYVEIMYLPVPEIVYQIFDFFRFSTSLINPLMYTFLKSDFRRALFHLIRSKFGRRAKKKNMATETTIGFTTVVRYKTSKNDAEETKKLSSI